MTRQHFKALASELNSIRPASIGIPGSKEREAFIQWTHAVEAVGNVCRQFNSRFNADRFRDACGWTETASQQDQRQVA